MYCKQLVDEMKIYLHDCIWLEFLRNFVKTSFYTGNIQHNMDANVINNL